MKFFNAKFIIVLLLVSVVVFGGTTSPVDAADIFDIGKSINGFWNNLLFKVLQGLSTALAYMGTLVDNVMQPQPILQASIVQTGWNITRDFANMFFILILLAIALSFILFPRFQLKQALPKLLLVALLINFSLPIAGIFIDFANVFTAYFLNQAIAGGDISMLIASHLNIQSNFAVTNAETIKIPEFEVFLNLAFGIVFTLVTIFIFAALGIMFLIRNVYLYILLILLPIVLVTYILPAGGRYFSQWTSKFFQWTFFAPIATFFIFLSMVSFSGMIQKMKVTAASFSQDTNVSVLAGVYDYLIIFLLLMGSLYAANSLGIETAGASINMLKKGGRVIRGGIGKAGARAGGMTARKFKVPEGMGHLAKATRYIPNVIGGAYATRALTGGATTLKAGKTKRAELSEVDRKLAEKMSDTDLTTSMNAGGPQAHAYAAILAKRGKLNEEDAGKMLERSEEFGSKEDTQAIAISNPLAATKVRKSQIDTEKDIEKLRKQYNIVGGSDSDAREKAKEKATERIWKSIKSSDIEKINPEILQGEKGETYINNLRKYSGRNYSQHIRAASRSGNIAFLDAEESSLKNMSLKEVQSMERNHPELIKWYNSDGAIGITALPEQFNSKLSASNKRKEIANQIRELRKQGIKTPEDREALKELTEELKQTITE